MLKNGTISTSDTIKLLKTAQWHETPHAQKFKNNAIIRPLSALSPAVFIEIIFHSKAKNCPHSNKISYKNISELKDIVN